MSCVSISSYNDLEFENFKCPSVKCEGHCDILDDKIRTMLRKIRSMEKSGQKLTIKDISLDSLTFFCSDIKRLEER